MLFLTLEILEKMKVCDQFQDEFIEDLGKKAKISIKNMVEYLNENERLPRKMELVEKSLDNNDTKLAEEIIKCDKNINVVDECGYTPLIWATENRLEGIIKLLIKYGADVNIAGRYGDTPLILATERGYEEIVELLINNGADVNIKNKDKSTALMSAISHGHWKIANLLYLKTAELFIK